MTVGQNTRDCLLLIAQRTATTGEIASLLRQSGLRVKLCPLPEDFAGPLAEGDCRLVLLDASDGAAATLSMLSTVRRVRPHVPILVLVRRADIAMAVRAMKAGASDCTETPVKPARLLAAVKAYGPVSGKARGSPLTPMERTVLQHLLEGRTNRQTADALSRSRRTVEVHRRSIMRKLNASNFADLVKQALARGLAARPDNAEGRQTPER